MGKINLYNGDCINVLQQLIDTGVKVDAIITGPPYGTSACKWDSVIDLKHMWSLIKNLIKDNGAIVLFGSEPFSSLLRTSNLEMYKYDWKWEKPNGANFLNFKYQPAKVYEDIIVFGKMAVSYSKKGNMKYNPQMEQGKPYLQKSGKQKNEYGNSTVRTPIKQVITENSGERYPRAIQKFNLDKEKLHPTQKPVALIEYLIKTYTNENDTVLDFTMGSGTTGVAAVNLNRNFIGIELDKTYFDIAEKRIKEAISKSKELDKNN